MKPTQVSCSEGSFNQIPPWTEMTGDIRLTPFYNIYDCMKKVEGYVKELNDGESCEFHSNKLCGHVLYVISNWFLDDVLTILIFLYPPSLYPDITRLPTRGPCSKYEISLEEGDFRGELELTFDGVPFKVRGSSCMYMV